MYNSVMPKENENQPQSNEEKAANALDTFLQVLVINPTLHHSFLKQRTRSEAMNKMIEGTKRHFGVEIKLSDNDIAAFLSLPDAHNIQEFMTGFNKIVFGPQGRSKDLDLPTD